MLREGVVEVKRMYVVPASRGQGLPAAPYTSEGFTPITAYGHFREDPRSLCFALDL